MIQGLSHITFIVKDLEKTRKLMIGLLGGKEIYSSGSETFSISKEAFFLVADIWIVAMEGDPLGERTYNHVALKISDGDVHHYKAAIESLGLEMRVPRERVAGEGQSIYFYDYDNHLFELHTGTLEERLERYAKGKTGG